MTDHKAGDCNHGPDGWCGARECLEVVKVQQEAKNNDIAAFGEEVEQVVAIAEGTEGKTFIFNFGVPDDGKAIERSPFVKDLLVELDKLTGELSKVRRERDLAVAHDRQPYPTAAAYEKVCATKEQIILVVEELEAEVKRCNKTAFQAQEMAKEQIAVVDRERIEHRKTIRAHVNAESDLKKAETELTVQKRDYDRTISALMYSAAKDDCRSCLAREKCGMETHRGSATCSSVLRGQGRIGDWRKE